MNITDKLKITNEDNMLLMARYPDNHFDLAIVDPPYGIGETGERSMRNTPNKKWKTRKSKDWGNKQWDKEPPTIKYFKELQRVSKNQIIWGANHFISRIESPDSSSWIIWDKKNGTSHFADGEMAWTSFNTSVRIFEWIWAGFRKQKPEKRIHPTQKPVKLYEWLLMNYAKENDKILDTHLGSGSIAIACHNLKYDLTACELDKDYYNEAIKRITNHTKQQTLF